MNNTLLHTIVTLDTTEITDTRKTELQALIDYIKKCLTEDSKINLNFICTHNSRRSHLSQIWAQTMAAHCGIKNIFCYSGGTEATAMFYKVAETLTTQGFEILKLSETENPVYAVKYNTTAHPIICFSKKYNHSFNPQSNYAGILTCNSADEACPIVIGAAARIPIKYEDPKAFDNTPQMDEKYLERSTQIATEMLWIMQQVVALF